MIKPIETKLHHRIALSSQDHLFEPIGMLRLTQITIRSRKLIAGQLENWVSKKAWESMKFSREVPWSSLPSSQRSPAHLQSRQSTNIHRFSTNCFYSTIKQPARKERKEVEAILRRSWGLQWSANTTTRTWQCSKRLRNNHRRLSIQGCLQLLQRKDRYRLMLLAVRTRIEG